MNVCNGFDAQTADGRDKGMENRHWYTAKHALAWMSVEEGDTVVDLGTGSGHALRAFCDTKGIGRGFDLDGLSGMAQSAHTYTDTDNFSFLVGDFDDLPFDNDNADHVWLMGTFYYTADPHYTLEEIVRVFKPDGTFYCAANYYKKNIHSHKWQEYILIDMTRWSHVEYREAFRNASFHVTGQDSTADLDTSVPAVTELSTDGWEAREVMVERYRTFGTLLTAGAAL